VKIKRLGLICGITGLVFLIAAIWLFHPNDLGLAGFDILLGGWPDVEVLRTNTKAVADAFLAQRKADLLGESDDKYKLALDYSKSSKIRSLGYRSSFYYYCWDIYLPYSLRTNSRDIGTIVVQLSDGVPDHRDDPQKFRVIRTMVLDDRGKVIKQFDSP